MAAKQEILKSINDIGLCLKSMIKTRYNKKVRLIYTSGKYKSLFLSFYKNHVWQFFVEDRYNYYLVYMLKDDKVIRKSVLRKNISIDQLYRELTYFFNLI